MYWDLEELLIAAEILEKLGLHDETFRAAQAGKRFQLVSIAPQAGMNMSQNSAGGHLKP